MTLIRGCGATQELFLVADEITEKPIIRPGIFYQEGYSCLPFSTSLCHAESASANRVQSSSGSSRPADILMRNLDTPQDSAHSSSV